MNAPSLPNAKRIVYSNSSNPPSSMRRLTENSIGQTKAFKLVTRLVGSKECYLPSMKELFLTIMKPPEVKSNKFSVSVSFFLFPCSKEHVVRAYLDTI